MAVTHLVTPCGLLPADILQLGRHSHQILIPQSEKRKNSEIRFWHFDVLKSSGPNKLNETRVGISISNEQPSPLILGICCWYEVNVLEKWITLLIAHNIYHTPRPPHQITASIILIHQPNSIVRSISILTELSGAKFLDDTYLRKHILMLKVGDKSV